MSATEGRLPTNDRPLTVPVRLWSPPIPQARWSGQRPRLSSWTALAPLAAMVLACLSALSATHGHVLAAGWLLAAALAAVATPVAMLCRHLHRLARYRAEAPR